MEINEREMLLDAFNAMDQKFGKDIVMMDIRRVSTLADYFIIASGNNPNQIQALASAAEEALLKHGLKLRHSEGLRSANWALLDFGDIIVHIFDKESRSFYNLERVWSDAAFISPQSQLQ